MSENNIIEKKAVKKKLDKKTDYKKEYKDIYLPRTTPQFITIPPIQYIMVEGKGDPNDVNGEYSKAVELLYAISYTIKMSKMGNQVPEGYFEYVVPPLEGLWWMSDESLGVDYGNKNGFAFISMIRQPEFVTNEIFIWACSEVERKKELDTSKAKLMVLDEGKCVQCMHIGSFDDEPITEKKIDEFIRENGLEKDISSTRRHHEIYQGDPRKIAVDKMKTVLRIPVK